ncbi:hypothetical protein C9J85_08360 [Haloferax sp. wsp5]|nr:hypothetical protein C9J85_08360 [Haloferax sp. wsp5]
MPAENCRNPFEPRRLPALAADETSASVASDAITTTEISPMVSMPRKSTRMTLTTFEPPP